MNGNGKNESIKTKRIMEGSGICKIGRKRNRDGKKTREKSRNEEKGCRMYCMVRGVGRAF